MPEKTRTASLKEKQQWAWLLGVIPMAAMYKLSQALTESAEGLESLEGLTATERRLILSAANREKAKEYEIVRELLVELTGSARVRVKLPKTFAAFKREDNAQERIEDDLYRELSRYDLAIAETMMFASRVGIWVFVKRTNEAFEKSEKAEMMEACCKMGRLAELDESIWRPAVEQYFDGKLEASKMVNKITEDFLGRERQSDFASTVWDALQISPNVGGIGVDLKKFLSEKRRRKH